MIRTNSNGGFRPDPWDVADPQYSSVRKTKYLVVAVCCLTAAALVALKGTGVI